jgi:hypothetical protein
MTPEDYILGIVHDGAWSREEFAEVMKEMPATLSEISLWMEGYAAMVLEEYIDSKEVRISKGDGGSSKPLAEN